LILKAAGFKQVRVMNGGLGTQAPMNERLPGDVENQNIIAGLATMTGRDFS
jgi:hypothetical protein